jgi:hypothetical protein
LGYRVPGVSHSLVTTTIIKTQSCSLASQIPLCWASVVHPSPHPRDHFFSCFYNFVFARMLYRENHAVGGLLRLSSFTHHKAARLLHDGAYICSVFVPFCGWAVSYCANTLQRVCVCVCVSVCPLKDVHIPVWQFCVIPCMHGFDNILLGIFASIFMRNFRLYFFSFWMSLSAFDTREMLGF